jgi:hypothetical protein
VAGSVDASGRFTAGASPRSQGGTLSWKGAGLSGTARIRLFPAPPWSEDFEGMEVGKTPTGWVGGASRFQVADREGRKVLEKPFMDQGIERSNLYIGPPSMSGYTIQADLLGSVKGRKRPDMGLIAGGYTLDLMGNHQRLQVRDWVEPRIDKTVDFPWQPDTWYTMKMQVRLEGNKAIIEGKVWPAGTAEPAAWSISVEDPLPVRQGSPGLYGYSAADIFYDNVKVMVSER